MDAPKAPDASATSGDGLKLTNRLNESRSPYVRGHMNNPVAWQMWGREALELAKKSDRLIFISIGYAACHWCHVMERESFENQEVANILNESFIPIKIDREERPDVDRIYMNYVQATTGGGGWPLNVFITPNLEPIFGGTYWPGPGSTMAMEGHTGFVGILNKIRHVWEHQRERCLESAKEITSQLREFAEDGNISRRDEAVHEGLELDLLDDAYMVRINNSYPLFPQLTPNSTSRGGSMRQMLDSVVLRSSLHRLICSSCSSLPNIHVQSPRSSERTMW